MCHICGHIILYFVTPPCARLVVQAFQPRFRAVPVLEHQPDVHADQRQLGSSERATPATLPLRGQVRYLRLQHPPPLLDQI